MTDQTLVLAIVLWCCVNAVIGYAIGRLKNEVAAAVTLSILFGPMGWCIMVFSKGNLRKCPLCAEHVKPEAVICKHCGNKLPPPEPPSKMTKKAVAIALGVVVIVVAGIILFPAFVPSRSYAPVATNPAPATTPLSVSTPSPAPPSSPPPPEFVTITKGTEARIPDTFEVITLKAGEQLRFVSLKGDQVRVQYGRFQAVVNLHATDLNQVAR
jgi:hypothetical protein